MSKGLKIKSKAITFKTSPAFAEELKKNAEKNSMSQSNFIEFCVRLYIDKKADEKPSAKV